MQITRAFQSRVEFTPEQERIAYANAGVRKFAYNDLLSRKEYYYALAMLNSEKPLKDIFSIKAIARILGIKWEYIPPSDQCKEWVAKLTDRDGIAFELRASIHGS